MKKLKIGILGCGKVAHLHAKAIMNIEDAEICCAWSRTYSSAEKFAAVYGIRPYGSIGELAAMESPDILIVCTPHPYHAGPVVEAAGYGIHLLVEKPLASSLEDSQLMIDTCKRSGVKLGVISQRRWYAPVFRLKNALEDGKIGEPVMATVNMLGWRDREYYESDEWRGTWSMEGGGVLVNQAPHQLDILIWLMGEVEEVYGIHRNLNHPYIEVEDTAFAIVKFKSGAIGNIIVSNSQKPGIYGKIHVHGSNGASVGVQTDGGAMFIAGKSSVLEPPVNDLWTVPGEEPLLQEWIREDTRLFNKIDPTVYYMECQIRDFMDAVRKNSDPLVTGEDGRKTVELFTGIYRSNRDNQPVRFPLHPETGRKDFDGRKVDSE